MVGQDVLWVCRRASKGNYSFGVEGKIRWQFVDRCFRAFHEFVVKAGILDLLFCHHLPRLRRLLLLRPCLLVVLRVAVFRQPCQLDRVHVGFQPLRCVAHGRLRAALAMQEQPLAGVTVTAVPDTCAPA